MLLQPLCSVESNTYFRIKVEQASSFNIRIKSPSTGWIFAKVCPMSIPHLCSMLNVQCVRCVHFAQKCTLQIYRIKYYCSKIYTCTPSSEQAANETVISRGKSGSDEKLHDSSKRKKDRTSERNTRREENGWNGLENKLRFKCHLRIPRTPKALIFK